MGALTGKVAIVTGASSGIGWATAKLLAAQGASVVAGARRAQTLQQLTDEIHASGGCSRALAGDVTDPSYARRLVACALDEFGKLDIAVNNAGTLGAPAPVIDMSEDSWHNTIDTNLTSGFLGAKHQIPALISSGAGSLIFTASFVGYSVSFPGMAAYAASKAGLIALSQTLALECAEHGVRVNAVLPGATETNMAQSFASSAEEQAALTALYPMGRIAQPEEIAQSILYLASDASSFTTGSALVVDGGISICRG